ncbi:MAG: 50S ribosomal protein L11 methyltransferase [Pseudomonadota bacterium]|nr:50S ribosomal protein L11 methyltransferase [Pseudomonadota bacterium]MEE2821157.1 50S ribosomal protein L11 methyltransferase [Pseudomonadota bacterium]
MTGFRQLTLLATGVQAELLEELLFLADAKAVTLVDDGNSSIFEPPVGSHPVWPRTQLKGLFYDQRPDAEILEDFATYLQRANILIELPKELTPLADQDWARASLDQFNPIKIGRLWVKPSWNDEPTPQDLTILNLDPGLAFGTGMHPTTQLCLEWLSANPPVSKTVMDFGCGSGILSVAAGCLGASQITGLDIDPQALIATKHNASLNHLVVETLLPDQISSRTFDVLIANILANPLIELASTLTQLTRPGGKIVMAGLLDKQVDQVKAAYPSITFDVDQSREGWSRLSGTKTN